MSRLPALRTAILLLAAVAIAGCSGAAATAAPPSMKPNEMMAQSVAKLQGVKTFHAKLTLTGEAKGDIAKSIGLPAGGTIKLDGTTLQLDADISDQANPTMHMTLSAPSIMGLAADIILVDGNMYVKTSLTGDKYQKQAYNGSGTSSVPLGPDEIKTQMQDLQKQLDQLGDSKYVGVDKVDGKDAYHFSVTVPKDKLAQAGAEASMTIDSASVDVWVYVADSLPAKLQVQASSADVGTLNATLTLTDYNKPIGPVKAPPASQVAGS